ncbi:NADase-type glycan-binding domain-containing protein [Pedobacter frigiditerrae]|uniref:NADase-type glycan-binding domain-containing protein n=1 Tax=Pedobacter frigiditerrae TaxID=2530452 RepID=UPI0029315743|nr:hypothetical protein [Pedobacter frigiditerrae]
MRFILSVILFTVSLVFLRENIKELTPTLGKLVDKSAEGETKFKQHQIQCESVWKKVNKSGDYEKLSKQDKKIYDNCSETEEDYWGILGSGCSWYCGGGLEKVFSSSSLKSTKSINYSASSINDLNYKTAWIEGIPGYGVGEFIVYDFPPENPRITKIIVVNGYVKSKIAWTDNSRVKKLKMYVDDKPYAILNLADSRQEQSFSIKPIGISDRKDYKKLKLKPRWKIKFEILDVYKGDKFDDTAITEIYFDGIDVH